MVSDPNSQTIPTPATPDVCSSKVLVEGKEIPGTIKILSVGVTRELNRVPSAILHIVDGEAALSTFAVGNTDTFIPGKKIEIQLGYRSNDATVFKGIVIKYSVKVRKSGSFLIVECRDEAVKMSSVCKSVYYEDKKDSDILEEIIDRYGFKKDVQKTTPDLKEVVQYDSTDWDFMLCRAEANGQFVMVEDGKIIVARPDVTQKPVLTAQFGSTILELDAEIDARIQSQRIKAHSWNAADQQMIEAEATEPATTGNGNLTSDTLAEVIGAGTRDLRHGGKLTSPELQVWADGQLLRERLGKVRGRAKFQGFAGVKPGAVMEILGSGERMEGKVYVSGVRHELEGGNWQTSVQFGINADRFAEMHNLRPLPAAGLIPAVSGLHIGIVTKLGGDPDGEDRIKVRLPIVSTQEEGVWARIAALDAGNKRGTYFRPEINDEVIVGFLHDDPRYPVILGMCHSSHNPAPETPDDDNNLKGYVTRKKMKLLFDDDKVSMTLETPAGNKFGLSEDAKGITMEDQNGNKITLDDKGITIESFKDLILKATNNIKMEGINAELKASASFKAQGSANAEISGAMTSVKGNASVVIQGGVVQIN